MSKSFSHVILVSREKSSSKEKKMALFVGSKNFGKLMCRPLVFKQFQIGSISDFERQVIGKREIVGFGHNGQPNYIDCAMVPFPAIRWREPSSEILALREKEKGDWNNLTCEEKKTLYRASFYQTFSEMKGRRHEWKSTFGGVMLLLCPAFWLFYFYKYTIYSHDPLPVTFEKERREQAFRRMLDLKMNPITGLAARWDYEKDDWKNGRGY